MASDLERSSKLKLKLLQSGDSNSSRQAMRSLVDYDSDGHPEREDATPDPQDEAPGQTQVLPDIDTIIQETKAEIQQTRVKADTLICRYFEAFIATAGQLREGAIQRYRERLEELPAKDRAKVCETLAKDEDVCSNMEFGNLHEVFVKDDSNSLLANAPEERRPSRALQTHSDDEKNGLGPWKSSSRSSSKESELSSLNGGSLSCGDSTGAFQVRERERGRNSFSPSPDWAEEDQAGSSDSREEQGPGRPSKQDERDVSKRPGSGRPPNGPWSEEEEAVIRETMATQLQIDGHLRYSRQATMNLKEFFPRRTTAAIKAKWLNMRTRDIWDEWKGTRGQTQVGDAKVKDLMEDPDLETHDEKHSGSFMEYDDDEDESSDNESRPGSNGLKKWKKRNMVPVLTKSALQQEEQTPTSSSRLPYSERPGQSEVAGASVSRRKIRPAKEHRTQLWSPREIEILTNLTKGFNKLEDIDFKYIAAQLPDPFRRSEKACKSFWVRRVESCRPSKDKGPTRDDEAPVKVPISSNLGPSNPPTKAKKRGTEASSNSGSRKLSKKARSSSQNNLLVRSATAEDTS
ncbi:hypothetical protein INS49_011908 [Diaporthe citri]|uniref:uncharacterized protein n=1 Tax=Diaporthe citri TaxID=83186 RepID=UPI001C7F073B|nr:uncharacterized protein INS49_011908 [Diaporthe citri]KAG6360841.1 hypothetical protein INS49_011908 [Diaporthe citri]